jgi:mannose-6-phosphate isomerase class I
MKLRNNTTNPITFVYVDSERRKAIVINGGEVVEIQNDSKIITQNYITNKVIEIVDDEKMKRAEMDVESYMANYNKNK